MGDLEIGLPEWEAPSELGPRSQRLWKELVLDDSRSPERLALLREALLALDRADQCREQLGKEGLTMRTLGSGNLRLHPLLKVEAESIGRFTRIWRALGLERSEALDSCSVEEFFQRVQPVSASEDDK